MGGVALPVDRMVANQATLGAFQLGFGRRLLNELLQLFQYPTARFIEFVRRGRDVDGEVARGDALGVAGAYRVGETAAVSKFEEESAALAGE